MKIADLVGNTPMVELVTGVDRPGIRLFAKLEGNNPGGSVKDRAARSMILGAEARGELRPGMRLIEPTSGNTGIALAMIATTRGYPIELVMPDNATAERVQTMRAFGAEVILTPAAGGMEATIDYARAKVAKGGYVMKDASTGEPKVILIATGSEVQYAAEAQKRLEAEGTPTRLVSMPSVEWFDEQDDEYKESVLPSSVTARVTVEAGIAMPWYRFLGAHGRAVSLEHYGASADAKTLFREYGFTPEAVVV